MAEVLNIDNLIINRIVRGTLFDKSTAEVIVSVDQLREASLECGGEQVFATDALGQNIAAFDRSKSATLTASNAILNFGLMAAQLGSDKVVATEENKLVSPAFELIEVKDPTKITLGATPIDGTLKYIYSTHNDKSKNVQYTLGTAASESEFAIVGTEITLPTDAFKVGDMVAVWYEKEVSRGVEIINSTQKFAKGGKFVLEVLACDVCDTNKEYYTYVIFNNAKFDNNSTIDFSNEAQQQFTINAMQDYCSKNNELFRIVVDAEQ
ncbi:hypothetical protein AALA22_08855 [Anaerovoracaceae bacterium 41-7]